jgi:hypothetical protein
MTKRGKRESNIIRFPRPYARVSPYQTQGSRPTIPGLQPEPPKSPVHVPVLPTSDTAPASPESLPPGFLSFTGGKSFTKRYSHVPVKVAATTSNEPSDACAASLGTASTRLAALQGLGLRLPTRGRGRRVTRPGQDGRGRLLQPPPGRPSARTSAEAGVGLSPSDL